MRAMRKNHRCPDGDDTPLIHRLYTLTFPFVTENDAVISFRFYWSLTVVTNAVIGFAVKTGEGP